MASGERVAAPPTLVVIIGPPAVGKMTVGQELAAYTGFRLFFNHRIIDLVTDYFAFGSEGFLHVTEAFNRQFYRQAAEHGVDLITTWGWDFANPAHERSVRHYIEPFLEAGGGVRFVELAAPLDIRLERNRTPNRRAHKKVDWATDEELARLDTVWKWNSDGNFPLDLPHIVIENSDLPADEAARLIVERFGLPVRG